MRHFFARIARDSMQRQIIPTHFRVKGDIGPRRVPRQVGRSAAPLVGRSGRHAEKAETATRRTGRAIPSGASPLKLPPTVSVRVPAGARATQIRPSLGRIRDALGLLKVSMPWRWLPNTICREPGRCRFFGLAPRTTLRSGRLKLILEAQGSARSRHSTPFESLHPDPGL